MGHGTSFHTRQAWRRAFETHTAVVVIVTLVRQILYIYIYLSWLYLVVMVLTLAYSVDYVSMLLEV